MFPTKYRNIPSDLRVMQDKQMNSVHIADDAISVVDLPPAMTEFNHSRYDTNEVKKRPQNDLCKGKSKAR